MCCDQAYFPSLIYDTSRMELLELSSDQEPSNKSDIDKILNLAY